MNKTLNSEEGSAILMAVAVGAAVLMMGVYMSNRATYFQKDLSSVQMKSEIANDRNMMLYDLNNRPLPQ